MVASRTPRLAITLGDPAGIGPEVILKALADPTVSQGCEITVVGSQAWFSQTYADLRHQALSAQGSNDLGSMALADPEPLSILEVTPSRQTQFKPGHANVVSGDASFAYLDQAIAGALAGDFDGIVTGPIAKAWWQAAGHNYAGQTELLAERAGVKRFGMLFVAESPHTQWTLRTLLATTHIPLAQVPQVLSPELLSVKLELLLACLQQDFGLATPRIAIAGLNPHSGEQGQLGQEEREWLIPWLEQQRSQYPQAYLEGPVPPDTLWVKPGLAWYGPGPAKSPQAHDAYLALYHDQGLIPTKLLAFDRAVNTTLGLPFIRTSPDHGTAFDIAGKGIADATSFKAAIALAAKLARQRIQLTDKIG